MSAFAFGSRERQLCGYYHEPTLPDRGNVLLCQPWGIEYQFAHRTMRFLATRLARQGWHALRFDYSGTGDSWGDTTVSDLAVWTEDILRAADELSGIGGLGPLSLVGLRLGGTMAASAAPRLDAIHKLVLWDPIVNGVAWLEELDRLSPPHPLREGGNTEVGRHTVTEAFRVQVSGIGSPSLAGGARPSLVLWTGGPPPSVWQAGEHDGLRVDHLPQPSPWVEDVALGAGRIPVEAVTRIVEWLEQ